jgi:hypothetical protein
MALTPKTAVVQVRLEPDLLARFQSVSDSQRKTVSQMVREWMYSEVVRFEGAEGRRLLKAAGGVSKPIPSADTFQLEKTPSRPVKTPASGKNRAQKRADKKRGL